MCQIEEVPEEMLELARVVICRTKERANEDVEEWAKRLADDVKDICD